MKRRELLGRLAAAAVTPAVTPSSIDQSVDPALPWLDEDGRAFLLALAEVVLPSELGAKGQGRVVEAFVRWLRNYAEGAEMDHGYGFTNLRSTGRSSAWRYPDYIAMFNRVAASRQTGASFASVAPAVRRAILEDAMGHDMTVPLRRRPGSHVVVDLLAFYFHGSAANDLCYRAAIGRDACRGLPGSEDPPSRF